MNHRSTPAARSEAERLEIVWLIWLYLALLVFEGALRKWILPSLSDVLLVIRDPIAVLIAFLAFQRGYLPSTSGMRKLSILFVAFIGLSALQTTQQLVPIPVLAFGIRTYFLHLPLIFVIGRVLTARDLQRMLLAILLVSGPMAVLMAIQFQSSPNDWINAGAGAGRLQIITALQKIRPAGTFSFISGPIFYFTLSAAILASTHFGSMRVPMAIRAVAWGALVLAAAVSGSRALIIGLIPIAGAAAVSMVLRPRLVGHGLRTIVMPIVVISSIWSADIVQEGLIVLDARFEEAGTDDILQRGRYESDGAISAWNRAPWLGLGLGLGTNAGGALSGGGGFQLGESEWSRVILEAGPVFGLLYLIWRFWLGYVMFKLALRAASKGYTLPILLLAASAMNIVTGPWGQPTTLGFAVVGAGLCMASARVAAQHHRAVATAAARPRPSVPLARRSA